jgi:hypothetical protein
MESKGNKYYRSRDLGGPHSRSYNVKIQSSILRRLEERQLSGRDLILRLYRCFHFVKFRYDKGLDSHFSLDHDCTRILRVLPPWEPEVFPQTSTPSTQNHLNPYKVNITFPDLLFR